MLVRRIVVFTLSAVAWTAEASPAVAQTAPATASRAIDSLQTRGPTVAVPGGLPVYLAVGFAFGQRHDGCDTCVNPENTQGFSGDLSLSKPMGHGLGVGVQASVWRHRTPGPPGPADSTGVPASTTLTNSLGNASLIFTWQIWHVWVQGGGGVAWAGDDYVPDGSDAAEHASGMGIGYTLGGGAMLPLAGPVSLAFIGNVNFGRYDLTTPTQVLQRGAKHRYVELGVGLTVR